MNITQQELLQHKVFQEKMVQMAKKMLANKQELRKEIREDMKNPIIRCAIEELKNRIHQNE